MIGRIAMSGAAVVSLCGAALAGPSSAAPAPAAVDTRSKAPIDITANEAEVIQSKCLAIWRGAADALYEKAAKLPRVEFTRPTSVIGKNTVESLQSGIIYGFAAQVDGITERIVAEGHVYYVTPQQNARGDHAVYSAAADQIVITGDVILVQGRNVARGDKLTLKVSTREATLESNAAGAARLGRVRAIYYPDTSGQSAEAAKP